jgi:hypothetical protein
MPCSVVLAILMACSFSASCFEDWSSDTSFSLGKRYYFDNLSVFVPQEDGWQISSLDTKGTELLVLRFEEGGRPSARITFSTLTNTDSVSSVSENVFGLPDSSIELIDEPYGTLSTKKGNSLSDGIMKAYQYCGTDEDLRRQQKARQIASMIATLVVANLVMVPFGYEVLPTPSAIMSSPPSIRRCKYFVTYLKAMNISNNTVLSVLLTSSTVDSRYSYFLNFVISSIVFGNKHVLAERQYTKFIKSCSAVMLKNGTYGQGRIDSATNLYLYFRKYDSKTTVRLPNKSINWYSTGTDTTFVNR